MNVISNFWCNDFIREAVICNDDGLVVMLYVDKQLVDTRIVRGHTLQYAENLAENFVMKWGEWSESKTDKL